MAGAPLAEALRRELAQAPRLVAEQASSTEPILAGEECILAVGAGDSYAAALALEACSRGRARALDPFDAVTTGALEAAAGRGCLLLALSVGGRTRSVLEAVEAYRRLGGRVVAVTGPGTPLARLAGSVVQLTYTGLAAGVGAARHLAMLAALAAAMGERVSWPGPAAAGCGALMAGVHAGAAEAYSSALYTVLKLYEAYAMPARSERLEQLVHAPVYAADSVALYLSSTAPRGRQEEVLEALREAGVPVSAVPPGRSCWETVLSQPAWALGCLAEAAERDGVREPRYKLHPGLERLTRLIYG
ncbi:hypothetical protein CF15_01545 [Pyrodictium occultum]|uniref:SIS domain-containing protein n=1 Tax=Pyrodictium occultum TaxID=2309 RepID=A0A0V8RU08_PYROC|nr:hypothetical protein [Pyrodictium occultum]KSW11548.1 hypothetical protein CF15_01545 [Pyrodictium occultum]